MILKGEENFICIIINTEKCQSLKERQARLSEEEEAAVAVKAGVFLLTTEVDTPILITEVDPLVEELGQDVDKAEAKLSGIISSSSINPRIRRLERFKWLKASSFNNRTTKGTEEVMGTVEEVLEEDMVEGNSRISQINGINQDSRLNNSMGITTRLNNSERPRNKGNPMGQVDKCIRHLLADNLKTTINSIEVLAIVEAKKVIVKDLEVVIKEGLPMATQIQA